MDIAEQGSPRLWEPLSAPQKVLIVLAIAVALFLGLFAYNLWRVYQVAGLCDTSYRWVELFVRLRLYHVSYFCD